ncbi:hypothetical protein [Escherichia coli]|uniref:hypothetical protein n=1 Tax=Escherichia coli TaxID=562 RepID=UPI0012FD2FC8|nr:hypothetical protein [Escherichia coli]QGY11009.1 hypothetical protein F6P95_03090 [Escherichia coli]
MPSFAFGNGESIIVMAFFFDTDRQNNMIIMIISSLNDSLTNNCDQNGDRVNKSRAECRARYHHHDNQ